MVLGPPRFAYRLGSLSGRFGPGQVTGGPWRGRKSDKISGIGGQEGAMVSPGSA